MKQYALTIDVRDEATTEEICVALAAGVVNVTQALSATECELKVDDSLDWDKDEHSPLLNSSFNRIS